jgi:hypothetical protein
MVGVGALAALTLAGGCTTECDKQFITVPDGDRRVERWDMFERQYVSEPATKVIQVCVD